MLCFVRRRKCDLYHCVQSNDCNTGTHYSGVSFEQLLFSNTGPMLSGFSCLCSFFDSSILWIKHLKLNHSCKKYIFVHWNSHSVNPQANIRAKRREEFKATQQEKPQDINLNSSRFFDPRLTINQEQRTRKSFKFFDQGRFERIAQRIRAKVSYTGIYSQQVTILIC